MEDRTVLVWSVNLDLPLEETANLDALLSPDERRRVASFRFARDRRRFTVAHGTLRALLGRCIGIPPAQVRFVTNPFGKPALHPELGSGCRFNFSHSADLALIAVAAAEVGVDVECLNGGADCLEVARHWFSAGETSELRSLPHHQQTLTFFDRWTRKEAWAKGRGEGLAMAEAAFASGPEEDWSLFPLRPSPGYVGAVAIQGKGWRLRERRWETEVPSGNTLVL